MDHAPFTYDGPRVLPLRQRARTVNALLADRFETLLPALMRETGFDMWLVICHEDNLDPAFRTLIPYECWAPILQIVVLYDPGPGKKIERLNLSRTDMAGLMTSVWNPDGPDDQWACLKQIVTERAPKRIGINQSDVIWAADGLTAALKARLVSTLGPDLAKEADIPDPKIYSHSLGHYLHEPGPLMGLPWQQNAIPGRGDVVMHTHTCYTVELSVTCPVPEWGNQDVPFRLEQDAAITEDGVFYIDGRQTGFHLI